MCFSIIHIIYKFQSFIHIFEMVKLKNKKARNKLELQ